MQNASTTESFYKRAHRAIAVHTSPKRATARSSRTQIIRKCADRAISINRNRMVESSWLAGQGPEWQAFHPGRQEPEYISSDFYNGNDLDERGVCVRSRGREPG